MKNYKLAVFVGSLRKESFNRKTAHALRALAPESLSLEFIDISSLPMFNEDLEATPPREWEELREQIRAADAFPFFTPEYNRSATAVFKKAIDESSRAYGHT